MRGHTGSSANSAEWSKTPGGNIVLMAETRNTTRGNVAVYRQVTRAYKVALRNLKYLLWDIYYHTATLLFMLSHEKQKLTVLYLHTGTQRYPRAYNDLSRLIKRIKGFEVTVVKIDNFSEHKEERKEGHNVYGIGGDNRYWEFSGWKKGMAFLQDKHIEPDLVMFVNDAFMNHSKYGYDYKYYKSRVSTLTLSRLKDSVLGLIVNRDTVETLLGYNVSSFIRSSIFAVPYSIAKKLQLTFITDEIIDDIFPQEYSGRIFNDTDKLNSNLRRFLEVWITQRWGRADVVTSENWGFLKSKLIAILNERLLTAKIRELDARIIDMDMNSVF